MNKIQGDLATLSFAIMGLVSVGIGVWQFNPWLTLILIGGFLLVEYWRADRG